MSRVIKSVPLNRPIQYGIVSVAAVPSRLVRNAMVGGNRMPQAICSTISGKKMDKLFVLYRRTKKAIASPVRFGVYCKICSAEIFLPYMKYKIMSVIQTQGGITRSSFHTFFFLFIVQ